MAKKQQSQLEPSSDIADSTTQSPQSDWGKINYPNKQPEGYYVYVFSVDGITRYVGKGIGDRLWHHERDIKRNRKGRGRRALSAWHKFLKKSLKLRRTIEVNIFSEQLDDIQAKEIEIKLIAETKRRHEGGTLMNFTSGGDGVSSDDAKRLNSRPEIKAKLRNKSKAMWEDPAKREHFLKVFKETQAREDIKEKRRQSIKRIWSDPEKKQAWSDGIRRKQNDPKVRAKKSKAIRQAQSDPNIRKKMSTAQKNNWSDAAVRQRHIEGLLKSYENDPDRKIRTGQQTLERWSDPEYRAYHTEKNREAASNPKRNEKISKSLHEIWKEPEHKQRRSENISVAKSRPEQKDAMRRANYIRKMLASFLGKKYHEVTKQDMDTHKSRVMDSEEFKLMFPKRN